MKFKAYGLILIIIGLLYFLSYSKESDSTNNYQPESKYPFIKITPIKNFYNNDYYGKTLNYRINSHVENEDKRYIVNYNVEYPQLYKIKNNSILHKVNNQLKMILFQDVQEDDYNQILNDFSSIINNKQEGVESAEGTCKIYLFDDDYISVGYKCNFFNGGTFLTVNRLLTINLSTGESVNLKDFVKTDNIIKNIKKLKFDILEGSYTDGFGTGKEDERISSFIEAFQESIENNSTEFSIDNTYLYLNFQYDDSLDGYMLLRFKLNDLKQ
jgi:hypothetical protein